MKFLPALLALSACVFAHAGAAPPAPGHETYAVYRQAEPLRVITIAVRWLAAPETGR